ncbi:acetate--CoA ligase family protein [Nonomuraea endophytica]|uniref:acetate--CoA ligase family protein n=1 Tax=Nonomuraea endophytica TaxID=714136 RepID=UPI0037C7E88F
MTQPDPALPDPTFTDPSLAEAALTESEAKALLAAAGIAVPRGVVVRDGDFSAAAGLTAPLVLKGVGPLHKSDVGAVRLGLTHADLPAEATAMAARADLDAYLVEEQAAPGIELIAGLVHDPGFGPVLLTGLGGVFTEALRDTALRLCPITETDARRMLASLRGAPLLYGYRGADPVDVDAVVKILLAMGGAGGLWERLDLGEFELNPVIATADGAIAVDARYIPGRHEAAQSRPLADFLPLFEPKAVAVVGASTTRPNFGNMFLEFYKAAGTPVVAVHPTADEIAGVPAVPSLDAADVDYALVAVPAARCPDVVRQAGRVPYVQVMSGGFGETGAHDLEAELASAARAAGTRLLGPNCMGVYSPRGRQTFVGGGLGEPGGIALVSQSGGLAGEVIKVGERRGLRFSRVATVGNAADVTPAELLRWLSADPETTAVGLYLEDPRDGRALFEAVAGCPKPLVMLVGGRSAQGRRAAASHTGGLVGDGRIWQALADQTGTTLVASQDDLIGVLSYFQSHARRLLFGDTGGVLVVGPSGGASVLAADVLDRAGLRLDPLGEDATDALRGLGVGVGSSLANPLEIPVGPRGRAELVREVVGAILGRQPYLDVVAHVNAQSFFTYGTRAEPLLEYARALAAAQEDVRARVTLVVRNAECAPGEVEEEVRRIVAVAGIPVYRSMEAAAVAVAAGGRHGTA